MPRKSSSRREYKFKIDAFSPETIPMARLAEYLFDLSKVFGHEESVHFRRVESGSTIPVIEVEWEAEPKVRERLHLVKTKAASSIAMNAWKEIDRKLAEDNAVGTLLDPTGRRVIRFPGRESRLFDEIGPLTQIGVIQGVPIRVGGEKDPVPVHLEDRDRKYIVLASRKIAKEIASFLFSAVVRVEGEGKWIRRADGQWDMAAFTVHKHWLVDDSDIRHDVMQLRSIPADWKELSDPLEILERIKSGSKLQ